MPQRDDFLTHYLAHHERTEVPALFTRWSAILGVVALLERNFYLPFGNKTLKPNMYAMFIGSPGTRKTTAINNIKDNVLKLGWNYFSPSKTSMQKFIADLGEQNKPKDSDTGISTEELLSMNANLGIDTRRQDMESLEPVKCFICADEFNNFIGNGNMDFISVLGELWDKEGEYTNRIKTSTSDSIWNPTINILSGNTQSNFKLAFPPEAIGQGFFSRMLFIYTDVIRPKIFRPYYPPSDTLLAELADIVLRVRGECTFTPEAETLADTIYNTWPGIDDVRFDHYANRRITHLLKLCMVCAAIRLSTEINIEDVIYANTMLSYIEHFMPTALGEFGKAKNSDTANTIINMLERATAPVKMQQIWAATQKDLDKHANLQDIMNGLMAADRIQNVPKQGFLIKRRVKKEMKQSMIDYSFLTDEERKAL